jgi:hypothetical protein
MSRLTRILAAVFALGCAGPRSERADLQVTHVGWSVCPITRSPQGQDLDDAGVLIAVVVRGGVGVPVGRLPGICLQRERRDAPTELAALECRDPHRDDVLVVRLLRLPDGDVAVEQEQLPEEQDRPGASEPSEHAPLRHTRLGTIRVPPGARVMLERGTPCRP